MLQFNSVKQLNKPDQIYYYILSVFVCLESHFQSFVTFFLFPDFHSAGPCEDDAGCIIVEGIETHLRIAFTICQIHSDQGAGIKVPE